MLPNREGYIVFSYLFTVCWELQHVAGQSECFLSCRTAGKLLGVDHTTAARYPFLLAHDGIVEAVEKSDHARRGLRNTVIWLTDSKKTPTLKQYVQRLDPYINR